MAKKIEYFTTADFSVEELFEYAKNHFYTAATLFLDDAYPEWLKGKFSFSIVTLDSAAFLAHLGIELLLKGCLLHEHKRFPKIHNIPQLADKISFLKILSKTDKELLAWCEKFSNNRYIAFIGSNKAAEIGQDDFQEIEKVWDIIITNMHDELYGIYNKVLSSSSTLPGKRVLERKARSNTTAKGKKK